MNAHGFFRFFVVGLIGIVGLLPASMSSVVGQAPRLRPGLRAPERDQERKAEGEARVEQADPEQAVEDADRSPAAETYRKGVEALDKAETDAAIALFSRAIQLDPKYAGAHPTHNPADAQASAGPRGHDAGKVTMPSRRHGAARQALSLLCRG